MDCRSFRRRLSGWLGAAWGGAVRTTQLPEDLLKHAAGCSRCARRLALALALQEPPSSPAPDLALRVTSAVEAAAARRGTESRLTHGSRGVYAAATLAAVALLVVALHGIFWPRTIVVELSFEAPEARQVAVVGDWNRWDPTADRLADPDGDGVWEIQLRLKRSTEPRYQFVVDGTRWSPDPKAVLQVDDGFGGTSSVLQI